MSDELEPLRAAVQAAEAADVAAREEVAAAQAEVAAATTRPERLAAQRQAVAAARAAQAAVAALARARAALTAAQERAALTVAPANVPVALLPVALQTRFAGDTLRIRVIPDEVHVEDHEPGLTEGEVQAGRTFWSQVWRGGTAEPAATDAEREGWARLATAIGSSRRAAWVADETAPTGGTRPARPIADDAELPAPPTFPEPPRRDSAWSQAATARTLPDRFVAIAYRRIGSGGQTTWRELARASGEPVDDELQLGFDPSADPPPVDDDGPQLPDTMKWLVDPDVAKQAGLLVDLPLPAGTTRVDRLVVLGVLGSVDPATSATRLEELLAGHHHSGGLALLEIGAPTNNTAADRSAFAARDDPARSFAVERRTPAPPPGSDGERLTRALGIGAGVLRGVAHSNDAEQVAAGRMNALLWPSSLGYWLETLAQPGPTDAQIADIRAHAIASVRGRGPLPPLRIGRQPYGVLPATSLRRWRPSGEPAGVVRAAGFLRSALPWWLDGIARAPVVRAGADPDQATLDMLGQAPVSSTVGVRSMVGANVLYVPWIFFPGATGAPLADEAQRQRWMALTGLRALGVNGLPYLGQLVAAHDPVVLLRLPYTVDPRAEPSDAATAWSAITTYLEGLRSTRTRSLQAQDPRTFGSLLALLARRSVMLERVRAGIVDGRSPIAGTLVEAHLRVDGGAVAQAQLVSTSATLRIGDARPAAASVLAGSVTAAGGQVRAMLDHLDAELVTGMPDATKRAEYLDTLAAAEAVAKLEPNRAALLLGESLDVASHRFDAWVTSLATRRLADMRASVPSGITLGAYGVVEDLVRRAPRPVVAQPPAGVPGPLVDDTAGAGYIHAPSPAQAATAAVLRAGHLAHAARDPNAAALAIDLSSSRVRIALGLLDGVRAGQPLGALLGYRVERTLHESGAHTAVAVLRRLAPAPVVTAAASPEGLQARAVCDGLALSRLARPPVLAAVAAGERERVDTALGALEDAVDAVADLLLAEGVHQIVRGNPDRAAAALDTLHRGDGAVSEPQVVSTPRTGTTITQRAVVLLADDTPAAPGWPADGTRARAEPRLAAWAGWLLGDPRALTVTVRAGEEATSIPFADLGLGALDLVYGQLAGRAQRRAPGLADGATVEEAEPRLAALLAGAQTLRELLSHARIGTGTDLARPQDRGGVVDGPPPPGGADSAPGVLTTTTPDVDRGDRRRRMDIARGRLQDAIAALDAVIAAGAARGDALSAALDALDGFGLAPGSDPAFAPSGSQLTALRDEATARLTASQDAAEDAAALFGEGFPVLALSAPPSQPALAAALAADPIAAAPAAVLAPLGGASGALSSWIETHGRVRVPIGRLADALLAARLRGGGAGAAGSARLRAIQQPAEPFPTAATARRGQWVGLPFPAALTAEPVTSLVAHALGDLDADRGIAVLVVDELTEVVPAAETTTGLSFGFDAPGARPPQTIMLAVPPEPFAAWTLTDLADVIGETLDLAKVRMVDLSSVAWAGRFIPTLYLTDGDVATGLDLPIRELVQLADVRANALADP